MPGDPRRCYVPGCNNQKSKLMEKVKLFQFPSHVERCARWVQAIRDPALAKLSYTSLTRYRFVCNEHFLASHITPTGRTTFNAVPQIFNEWQPPLSGEWVAGFLKSVPAERSQEVEEFKNLGYSMFTGIRDDETSEGPVPERHKPLWHLPEDEFPPGSETSRGQRLQTPEKKMPWNEDRPKNNKPFNVPTLAGDSEGSNENQYADEGEDENAVVIYRQEFIEDTSIIDHDYLGYNTYRASQIQEHPAVKGVSSSQLVLNDMKKDLCRLCGQRGSNLTPIFEPLFSDITQDLSLNAKIELYLPFKIKKDDPLPPRVCSNCHDVLNKWHELYVTCVAANAVLWKTFGRECDKSQNRADSTIPRVEGESITKGSELQIKAEFLVPALALALDQEKEHDVLSAEHKGKNTREKEQQEEEEKDEFDKCFANVRAVLYKCRFCFEFFETPVQRKAHVAMCRQLPTICELCGHKVPCRKDLRRHRYQKHTEKTIIRKYLCNFCDKGFRTPFTLRHHVNVIHEGDNVPKYHCERCCRVFVSKHHHRSHMRQHDKGELQPIFKIEAVTNDQNPETPSVYSCPVCQELFNDTFSLVIHLTTKKKIKCSVCQKVSASEKRFMLHQCGQWTCQFCAKPFDKKVKLIVHERLHTGERPLKCRICDETFRTWQSRRHHETSHEPLFECHYCGKTFRNKYVFEDHVQCHEGKIFACPICNKTFSGRKNLRKHKYKFHRNPVTCGEILVNK